MLSYPCRAYFHIKQQSVYVIQILCLAGMLVVIFLKKPPARAPVTEQMLPQLAQADPHLLRYIGNNYLLPPPGADQERNLTRNKQIQIRMNNITKVVHKLLNNKKNGFFIEAGANDGEFLSNSLSLEVLHGWSGLLVEADPAPLENLKRKHRKAWISNSCLSPKPRAMKVEMISHVKWQGIGNIPEYFKGNILKSQFTKPFPVQCFPLASILLAIGMTQVDYLSLDVEGAEYQVLSTIPFDKISIQVISVETNKHFGQIRKLLLGQGYKFVRMIQEPYVADAVYFKPTTTTHDGSFIQPINFNYSNDDDYGYL